MVEAEAPWADDPAKVVALVPATEVVALTQEVPAKTVAQMRGAARYAVEPFITEDIEAMHIAFGPLARHRPVRCLVVPRATMRDWLDVLAGAGLVPGSLIPDAMALPVGDESTVTALHDGDEVLLRGQDDAARLDADNLDLALQTMWPGEAGQSEVAGSASKDAPVTLRVVNGSAADDLAAYGAMPMTVEHEDAPGSVLAYLAAGVDTKRCIDLLQGDFAVKRRASGAWAQWRAAAAVGVAWLVIALGVVVGQGMWASQRADGYRDDARDLYRDIYGSDNAPANPAATMRVRLGQAPESEAAGFLLLLGHLGVALKELPGAHELRRASFSGRTGFGAELFVADYEALDSLSATLQAKGLTLEVVSAEQQDSRIRASIRIAEEAGA